MNRAKRKGHLSGGKITESHTTIIQLAKAPVLAAEKSPLVKKISLHEIKRCKSQYRGIKFADINGGFQATIIGSRTVQKIMLYLVNPTKTNATKAQIIMLDAFENH